MSWQASATVDHIYPDGNTDKPLCRRKPLPPKDKELTGKKCSRCLKRVKRLKRRLKKNKPERQAKKQLERSVNHWEYKKRRAEETLEEMEKKLSNKQDYYEQYKNQAEEKYERLRQKYIKWTLK